MSRNEKFIDYGKSLTNYEGEKVHGLHLSMNRARALFISHRVKTEKPSMSQPFYLPKNSDDLRKVAQAINELADYLDGK